MPPALKGSASTALFNVGWRYLLARRWQSVLMIIGIALGVAVVVSIDLANASAQRAFTLSTESVTGKSTHQIEGPPQGIDETLYARLVRENVLGQVGAVGSMAPVVTDTVLSPQLGATSITLLGIDPFADAPFRQFLNPAGGGTSGGSQSVASLLNSEGSATAGAPAGADLSALSAFLTQPGALLIGQPLAERFHLKPGDTIDLFAGGYRRKALIAGILIPANDVSARSLEGLLLADIATAQELTGQVDRLNRIDLILPKDQPGAVAALQNWLPSGYRVTTAAARAGAIQQMTAAFELNLTALSLLALVVGLFLIYNTMTFSVVQRRGLFGTLRCLGVTRREVFVLVLGEAVIVGALGGLLGVALGLALGQITVAMVTQTVNDLYFTTTVRSVGIDPASLVKGFLLGLLATVFTAALPAWEAASVPPRAALLRSGLEAKTRRSVGWLALLGLLAGGFGLAVFALPSTSVIIGFTGTLLVVLGFALLSSAFLIWLMRLVAPLTARLFGLIGRLAPRNLISALSRTAVAVAALMVAVAVIIGVGLMIDSFRYTVIVWLTESLQGDVYITVPSFIASSSQLVIDPKIIPEIQRWPGVTRVDTLRQTPVETPAGRFNLSATENPTIGQERLYAALRGTKTEMWSAMQSGAVMISEPAANRFGITPAQVEAGEAAVRLFTNEGWRDFPVQAIYYDYASSEGIIFMAIDVYRQHWHDSSLTALSLRLAPGVSAQETTRALEKRFAVTNWDTAAPDQQLLMIRSNQDLRSDVLEVFDRTFAITIALRILATGVAFVGVLNALLLLQLEKQREVGILRALGLTGRQLWRLVMLETGLMGLVAGLLAMPTGYALAAILVYVINRRSFGWTLQMDLQPEIFAQALAVALIAALLAGIYPAWKLGRMPAAEVIRYE